MKAVRPYARITVTPKGERALTGGHPWVYEGEVVSLEGTAEDGGLRVSEADCPTQDCVHTGAISRSGQSIVCLPARIIIQLTGGQADPGGVDVVIG